MCRIAEEIKAEGRREGQIDTIRRIMAARSLSFEQACDDLLLPAGERDTLAAYFQAEP